jgi:Uma2 family endonuclease
MNKFTEIRYALARLSQAERAEMIAWLQRSKGLLQGVDRVEEPQAEYRSPLLELMDREKFLKMRQRSLIPFEYVSGVIRPINGGPRHCTIRANVYFALRSRLRGGECETFSRTEPLDLILGEEEIVYEPDVFVSCDRSAWTRWGIPNPKVAVEVLSAFTDPIDWREKGAIYRRVASLDEYAIASQEHPEVTIYRRAGDWKPDVVSGLQAMAEFRSLGLSIPLAEIYENAFSARTQADFEVYGVQP